MPTQPRTPWEQEVTGAMAECVTVFGEGNDSDGIGLVEFQHYGGIAYQINGIFEAQTEKVDLETGFMILSNQPSFHAPLSVFEQIPKTDDECLIRGIRYRVDEPEFDGQGTVSMRLKKI